QWNNIVEPKIKSYTVAGGLERVGTAEIIIDGLLCTAVLSILAECLAVAARALERKLGAKSIEYRLNVLIGLLEVTSLVACVKMRIGHDKSGSDTDIKRVSAGQQAVNKGNLPGVAYGQLIKCAAPLDEREIPNVLLPILNRS